MKNGKPPKDDPEILRPGEEPSDDEEEASPPEEEGQVVGRRERSRKLKEKEKSLEITERGMLIELLGKLAGSEKEKTKILEVFDKSRHREGSRAIDLQKSQRDFIYSMKAVNDKQFDHIVALFTAQLENVNKIGELIVAKSEAEAAGKKSTVLEVIEGITMATQIPIIAELQAMLMDSLQAWREKKNKGKKKPKDKEEDEEGPEEEESHEAEKSPPKPVNSELVKK